jgi:hypothetical protein
MAIDVEISFATPAPEDCPTTFTENVELLNELVSGSIVANITPYVRQAATPGVDQQNLVWHKIDVDGRPIGTFHFYSGSWRREYSGRQDEIRYYMGDPAIHFESNGRGIVGGEWDGFALCNGNNGTPNLSDKFIVGAKMDDLGVGYPTNGPWKTNVSGSAESTGGVNEITLTDDTTYRPAKPAVELFRRTADGETPDAAGGLFGFGPDGASEIIAADPGNETPDAIPTLPPFYALAITKWIGYI